MLLMLLLMMMMMMMMVMMMIWSQAPALVLVCSSLVDGEEAFGNLMAA